ncbi:hypothetical protein ACTXPA_17625 [Glutamicibacter arilaitensis]|uniref:hypothetical protein n=1 Tax=Glutamicibacter arilaitensis TaxID=256701 RepID=UPI003FD346AC
MRGLTLEQAADKANIKPAYFRYLMSQLNGTNLDLRTPPEPGERARRYSAQKLAAWIKNDKPLPSSEAATEVGDSDSQRHLAGKAVRTTNGNGWTVSVDDPSVLVEASTLQRAWALSRMKAAEALGVELEELVVDVTVQFPANQAAHFETSRQLAAEAEATRLKAEQHRLEGIHGLVKAGWRNNEIAAAMGMTPQRIQQLLAGK